MNTSIMFINQSQPLAGAFVRLAGDGENVLITDDEGKITIDLIQGTHVFEIQVDEEWITREVNRKGNSPLFIVDVGKRDSGQLSTLNTLQVDIAEMVGDRYVFETVLGRGGMGVVVKAIDRLLNRPVAIKMLSDELQDNDEAQQIFLVEARNLATLSHPNLVAIHDILTIEGRVLMVFEYVLGENLDRLIKKNRRIEQIEALRIAIQLTRVVAYLHDHELIHRDLKPSNVIIQQDGTLKLIDFGLARSLNELYIRGTRVRGTPAYMAPEQVMGIHLTVQTDLYQIGISLYESLVGDLPFDSGDMAYAHVHKEPPRLLERLPDLDPELAALVHQLLEKQPKDRPASSREVLERLSGIYSRLTNGDQFLTGLSEPSVHNTGPISAINVDEHFDSFEEDIEIVMPFDDPDASGLSQALSSAELESAKGGGPPIAAIAAIIAILAIIGIVVLQFAGPSENAAAQPPNQDVVAADPNEPTLVVEEEPEPVEEPTEVAEVEEPTEEPAELEEPLEMETETNNAPAEVAPVAAKPKPAVKKPVYRAKKTQPKPKPVPQETKVVEKPAEKPVEKTKPKKTKKNSDGLLSVDGEPTTKEDSLLLPVGD